METKTINPIVETEEQRLKREEKERLEAEKKKKKKMSKVEKKKLRVINKLIAGEINGTKAAEMLKISTRQVRNLKRQVLDEGLDGVIHKNKQYKPYNTYDTEISTFVCKVVLKSFSIVCLQICKHSSIELPKRDILKEFKYNFNDFDSTKNSLSQLYRSFITLVIGTPFCVNVENS